jgi:hypothetical protein
MSPPPAAEPVERLPPPSRLRRERRNLARHREVEIRDVGGLAVEMARRDRFKPELIFERANDVLQIEQRINELDGFLLAAAAVPRGTRSVQLCRCGAPLLPGSHFCSHCGRPSPAAAPVITCSHCGQPLPADTNFCSFCGNPVAGAELGDAAHDETIARHWSAEEEA